MLEFVTFHVSLSSDEAVHPNQTLKHKDYHEMIGMMFASARLFHRRMTATILSDGSTSFKGLSCRVKRVRSEIDPNKLMLERTNAQLRHIRQSSFSSPIVILDSDMLINSSFLPIFERDFDVAVTWRAIGEMPINGGLLILNSVRPKVSKLFFERFAAIYKEKYASQAAWFGDQLALRDCVSVDLSQLSDLEVVVVKGCRILLLPCDSYNFSPRNQYSEICSDLADKFVLHFKGERKRLMGHFWKAWLRPRRSFLPWVRLNGAIERRWLRHQSEFEQQAHTTQFDKGSK